VSSLGHKGWASSRGACDLFDWLVRCDCLGEQAVDEPGMITEAFAASIPARRGQTP
jgi:hypothetical protein